MVHCSLRRANLLVDVVSGYFFSSLKRVFEPLCIYLLRFEA
jgi:hypothetical protein